MANYLEVMEDHDITGGNLPSLHYLFGMKIDLVLIENGEHGRI